MPMHYDYALCLCSMTVQYACAVCQCSMPMHYTYAVCLYSQNFLKICSKNSKIQISLDFYIFFCENIHENSFWESFVDTNFLKKVLKKLRRFPKQN
jgi:hypothetical protein